MAYKQNPGRGNHSKTGHGLPSPFKQLNEETKAYLDAHQKAKKIVALRASTNKFNEGTEVGATTDSIINANPKNSHLFTLAEKQRMGNAAANKARVVNKSNTIVERSQDYNNRTGYSDTYRRKTLPPTKQIGAAIVKGAKDVGAKVIKGIKALDKQANKGSR